jgi:hypothetical protein
VAVARRRGRAARAPLAGAVQDNRWACAGGGGKARRSRPLAYVVRASLVSTDRGCQRRLRQRGRRRGREGGASGGDAAGASEESGARGICRLAGEREEVDATAREKSREDDKVGWDPRRIVCGRGALGLVVTGGGSPCSSLHRQIFCTMISNIAASIPTSMSLRPCSFMVPS